MNVADDELDLDCQEVGGSPSFIDWGSAVDWSDVEPITSNLVITIQYLTPLDPVMTFSAVIMT